MDIKLSDKRKQKYIENLNYILDEHDNFVDMKYIETMETPNKFLEVFHNLWMYDEMPSDEYISKCINIVIEICNYYWFTDSVKKYEQIEIYCKMVMKSNNSNAKNRLIEGINNVISKKKLVSPQLIKLGDKLGVSYCHTRLGINYDNNGKTKKANSIFYKVINGKKHGELAGAFWMLGKYYGKSENQLYKKMHKYYKKFITSNDFKLYTHPFITNFIIDVYHAYTKCDIDGFIIFVLLHERKALTGIHYLTVIDHLKDKNSLPNILQKHVNRKHIITKQNAIMNELSNKY